MLAGISGVKPAVAERRLCSVSGAEERCISLLQWRKLLFRTVAGTAPLAAPAELFIP
jgi:hypothetical protein